MPTAAVLPIKRFDSAKQRLNGELGSGTRAALASAMFADVLAALRRVESCEAIVVVSGEPRVHDLVADTDVVLVRDPHDKGQSAATRSGLARSAALGCERAILIPGDCPLLDPSEIDALLQRSRAEVVIVPDRHESGTNALVINPSGPFEPQFGPDSMARHIQQAERRDLSCALEQVPSLATDVDTPDDLMALAAELMNAHGRAPRTKGVMRQIERSRLSRQKAVA